MQVSDETFISKNFLGLDNFSKLRNVSQFLAEKRVKKTRPLEFESRYSVMVLLFDLLALMK